MPYDGAGRAGFSAGFIGGEGPAPARARALVEGARVIGAADSGLIACEEAGFGPAFIIGDMDSLEEADCRARLDRYPPEAVFRYPHDKDWTDTELLLLRLWDRGEERVKLIGGGGGRLDHTLALRALFERERRPLSWHTRAEDTFALDAGERLLLKTPCLFSAFPLGEGPWQAESAGLRWPLEPVRWARGFAGLSNRTCEEGAYIRARAGRFMVVVNV